MITPPVDTIDGAECARLNQYYYLIENSLPAAGAGSKKGPKRKRIMMRTRVWRYIVVSH